ncbi:4-amino-4-deoxy-L-arabinose transferase-like glycosyltransferase [Saccharomonospora amisosensis]|uniref:4-amino-4-deoxy-L-arabinose transferase-like glycosyltransferase n=1 Tax=Saccharomonospora amisosensis TaxID=1128677 RepID=A0A7X5ZRX2_9PSEU|nr:hypothetical protein [Saccharomonospora amisosensis]NIJ13298.1 4-amino-4-deoxy-L-arabinose transferase-like glycosyltransferase [Saccharomonospora amisosensis]
MMPTPESRDSERAEVAELWRDMVAVGRLRHPRTHLGIIVVLGVLGAVCLLATITRMSALPLVPLLPLAVAAYSAWRARNASSDRSLLWWVMLLLLSVAVCIWLVALVGRILQ